MSVLVKGMKMPECCDVCTFCDWSNLHQTACCKLLEYEPCFERYSREYKMTRSERCPLIEIPPHGRLIDERVAYDKIAEQEGGYYMDMDGVDMGLQETPTVIEAEEDYGD